MRKRFLLPLLTALAACGQGDPGPAGPVGADGSNAQRCTATEQAGRWIVQCPDGSQADLDVASCQLELDDDGGQQIRCPDGSEATVLPGAGSLLGSIAGTVRLEAAPSSSGVLIELLGTEQTATSRADGSYLLEGVAPGNYEIRFSLAPYQPQVVSGISSFGGIFEVETVVLRSARRIPQDWDELSYAAAIALVGNHPYLEIHDLAAGEVHHVKLPVGSELDDAYIEADGTVVLIAFHGLSGNEWFGTWRAGEGAHWYKDVENFHYARSATLIERILPGGAIALWLVREGIETPLEIEDIDHLDQVGSLARWMIVAGGRTLLVDAEDGEPSTTEISPTICSILELEETGMVGLVPCGGVLGIYDFSRASWIVIEEEEPFRTVSTIRGAAAWGFGVLDTELSFYDAFSGNTSLLTGDRIRLPSGPLGKWLWSVTVDGLLLERRDGVVSHLFEPLAALFSPDEDHFAGLYDGSLHLADLGTGEIRTIEDLQHCRWINADGLLCSRVSTDVAVIVALDGTIQELEHAPDYEIEAGWLVYAPAGRVTITAPGRGKYDLGRVSEISFSESGVHVAWINSASALFALNLETGEKARLSLAARYDLFALDTGVLFSGSAFPFGTSDYYVPYPW